MTDQQYQNGIDQMTEAIRIMMNVEGLGGSVQTHHIINMIAEERSKFSKQLEGNRYTKRKAERDLEKAEKAKAEQQDPRTMPHHKE